MIERQAIRHLLKNWLQVGSSFLYCQKAIDYFYPMATTFILPRPNHGDCADYYFRYIDQIPEDVDILTYLHTQCDWFGDFLSNLSAEQLAMRYAPGKWSLAELVGHVIDTEWIFAYRMLSISRGEQQSLPGFEQDDYVAGSAYHLVSPADLAASWRAVRQGTICLARQMTPDMAGRVGKANNYEVRASAIPFIMAGHVNHHYAIAKERYLNLT